MSSHLLDTDIAVEVLRKRDRDVLARLSAAAGVAVSAISVAELRFGAERSADPRHNHAAVDEFVAFAEVVSFDEQAARCAGALRQELAAVGRPIGGYDVLIAGHAIALGRVLVTRNVREFARVPGLTVEHW